MDSFQIKSVLNLLGADAKKSLGQHFLTSTAVVEKMVAAANIKREDTILEIGPGLGILTEKLVSSPTSRLLLCEKDRKFCEYLKTKITNNKVKIICDDALILIPNLQVDSPFKVISNLPYNISSPVMISLLTVSPVLPSDMVLMLQKEVAERLVTKPHDSNRGLLTVLVQLFGEVKIIEKVSKNLFYPSPQVDSAVIGILNIKPLPFDARFALKMLKFAFSGKRKKIKNSLFSTLKISLLDAQKIAKKSGFTLEMRPEELNSDQWFKLIKNLETLSAKAD